MVSGWSLEVLSFHAYKITETWGAMKILSLHTLTLAFTFTLIKTNPQN